MSSIPILKEKEEESSTSITFKMKEAFKTFKNVTSKALEGEQIIDKELAKERMLICEKCIFFKPARKQCVVCGCFISLKAPLVAADCPRGYWELKMENEIFKDLVVLSQSK